MDRVFRCEQTALLFGVGGGLLFGHQPMGAVERSFAFKAETF